MGGGSRKIQGIGCYIIAKLQLWTLQNRWVVHKCGMQRVLSDWGNQSHRSVQKDSCTRTCSSLPCVYTFVVGLAALSGHWNKAQTRSDSSLRCIRPEAQRMEGTKESISRFFAWPVHSWNKQLSKMRKWSGPRVQSTFCLAMLEDDPRFWHPKWLWMLMDSFLIIGHIISVALVEGAPECTWLRVMDNEIDMFLGAADRVS